MKVLVTGGTGFVGTNLIKRLLKDGHEVVSVDNYSTGKKENHQEGCQYHDFDLSSSHTLGIYVDHGSYPQWRDDEYDVIFHLAALARIQPSLKNPHEALFNNFLIKSAFSTTFYDFGVRICKVHFLEHFLEHFSKLLPMFTGVALTR